MIIGVSGKINSGKDTIGSIIQYLTLYNDLGYTHPISANDMGDWIRRCSQVPSNWEIRKFADKLKECVSLITGISRANLEREDVKNSNLPEDWDYELFASPESLEPGIRSLSVRELLQKFGTEVGRSIHPNFWVNALFNNYKIEHFMYGNTPYVYQSDDNYRPDDLNHCGMSKRDMINLNAKLVKEDQWIITDVRFPNELAAIKERGGIVIRVNREDERSRFAAIDKPEERSKYYHPSETSLDNAKFDYTIENNGTIDDLIIKIREILIKEKIIT